MGERSAWFWTVQIDRNTYFAPFKAISLFGGFFWFAFCLGMEWGEGGVKNITKFKINVSTYNTPPPLQQHWLQKLPTADTTHEAPYGSASLNFSSASQTLALLRFSWSLGNRRDSNNFSFSFLRFYKAPTVPSTKKPIVMTKHKGTFFWTSLVL